MPRMLQISLLALATSLPLSAQQPHSYTLSGGDITVYNIAGEVSLSGGSGADVTVEVTVAGHDAARLTVEDGDLRGRQTLRVLYPEDRIVYPALGRGNNTNFTIRDDGTWGESNNWHGRSDGRKVTIRGDGSGLEAFANLRIAVPAGKRVSVYLGVGRIDVSNVDGDLRLDAASADVNSRGTRGGLNIDTGSGDVAVQDASGTISLDTGSGDVHITHMKGGELKVDTGSGSVDGTGIVSDALSIDAGSGDIKLEEITVPRLALETGSGSVNANLKGTLDRLHVETGSGDVTIRLPESISATVDLDTGSGDFVLDFPLQLTKKSEGNLSGRLGDGRGRIEIETGSGDIALVK